jgi:formylglycine-generating enzyme required for sulfatase activity
MARIFLCHASEDKAQVREIYHRLRAIDGLEPWLDEEDLLPGQDWAREIPLALRKSDFILIFLSRTSVAKRGYVQREMKLALDAWQEIPEGTIHTIPVRIDECDVPESFRRYHYANLFVPNGFDRIVRAVRGELAKRAETTPPPGLQPEPSTSLSEAPTPAAILLEPTFTNSIGMEFVLIPAGTFMMGSLRRNTEAFPDERPAHRVTIGEPFYLGKYPVTQAQWGAIIGYNPSRFKGHPNQPVEGVSWSDVCRFLYNLNDWEDGEDYCLPTEAQWEYACRAGTDTPRYHHDVDAIAWYEANSNHQPQPVGHKLPNAWGLYDMLGNVWEWCRDGLRQYTTEAAVDPMGPTNTEAARILRGGSWDNSVRAVRAANRHWGAPDLQSSASLGFRCACSGRRR